VTGSRAEFHYCQKTIPAENGAGGGEQHVGSIVTIVAVEKAVSVGNRAAEPEEYRGVKRWAEAVVNQQGKIPEDLEMRSGACLSKVIAQLLIGFNLRAFTFNAR